MLEKPLGISFAETPAGLVVDDLVADGNADLSNDVYLGDTLVSVNDFACEGKTFDAIMDVIIDAQGPVKLVLAHEAVAPEPAAAPTPAPTPTPAPAAVPNGPTNVTLAFVEAGSTTPVAEASLDGNVVLRTAMLDGGRELYDTWGKLMNCGGAGQCGTCVVRVLEGGDLLSERTDAEVGHLGSGKERNSYRLACQVEPRKGAQGRCVVEMKPKKK